MTILSMYLKKSELTLETTAIDYSRTLRALNELSPDIKLHFLCCWKRCLTTWLKNGKDDSSL